MKEILSVSRKFLADELLNVSTWELMEAYEEYAKDELVKFNGVDPAAIRYRWRRESVPFNHYVLDADCIVEERPSVLE